MGYAMAAQAPGGAEVIRRIEIGEITPAAGEVVIEHEAIGVNFIDIYIRTGAYPWPVDKDLILGSEGAGTVTAVGEGVTHLAVGNRVGYTLPNGAYATTRAINAGMVVKLPDAIASDATSPNGSASDPWISASQLAMIRASRSRSYTGANIRICGDPPIRRWIALVCAPVPIRTSPTG